MDTAEQIRQSLDIVQVIGEVVSLRRAGRDYTGLCPFHGEKTPSFSVSPSKQLFYCFGCHTGGNIFNFVQRYYSWDFHQALEELGRKAGIKVEGFKSDPLWEEGLPMLEMAAVFFQEQLSGATGKEFRAYLKDRQIPDAMAEKFRLGAHSGPHQILLQHLKSKRQNLDIAAKLGLIGGSGAELSDRFRGRLMFPIIDERGRIRGFGGRSLGTEHPKYINSPRSSLFDKGRLLYGMHLAHQSIQKKGYAVLVEGYLDVMALHEFGVTNSVGSMGTALTIDQIRILKKIAPRAISLFDADKAGLAATEKNLGHFLKEGIEAKVAFLPNGKDPDEFLHRSGLNQDERKMALRKVFEKADLALDYLIRTQVLSETTAMQRAKRLRELVNLLDQIPDELERTMLKKDIAKRFELSEELLRGTSIEPLSPAPRTIVQRPKEAPKSSNSGLLEKEILKLLVLYGDREAFNLTDLLSFLSSASRWSLLLVKLAESGLSSSDVAKLEWLQLDEPEVQDTEIQAALHSWIFETKPELSTEELQNYWSDSLKALKRTYYKAYSQKLQAQIIEAEKVRNQEALSKLLAEKRDLARVLQSLQVGA